MLAGSIDDFDEVMFKENLAEALPGVHSSDILVSARAASVVVEAVISTSSLEITRSVHARLNEFVEASNGARLLSALLSMTVMEIQPPTINEEYVFLPAMPPMPPLPIVTDEWIVLQGAVASSAALLLIVFPLAVILYACCLIKRRRERQTDDGIRPPEPIFPLAHRHRRRSLFSAFRPQPMRRNSLETAQGQGLPAQPRSQPTSGAEPGYEHAPPIRVDGVNLIGKFQDEALAMKDGTEPDQKALKRRAGPSSICKAGGALPIHRWAAERNGDQDTDEEAQVGDGELQIVVADGHADAAITMTDLQQRIHALELAVLHETFYSPSRMPNQPPSANHAAEIKLEEARPRKVRVRRRRLPARQEATGSDSQPPRPAASPQQQASIPPLVHAVESTLADAYREFEEVTGKRNVSLKRLDLPAREVDGMAHADSEAVIDRAPDTWSNRAKAGSTMGLNLAFRAKAQKEAEARRRYAAWEAEAEASAIEDGWRIELVRREREAMAELVQAVREIEQGGGGGGASSSRRGRGRSGTVSRPPRAAQRRRTDDEEQGGQQSERQANVRQIV